LTLIFEGLIVSKFLNYETVNRKKCWTANPDSYILYRTIQNIGKKQSMEASPTQRTYNPLNEAYSYWGEISIRTESYALGFDEPLSTQAIATEKPVPIEASKI